METTTIKCDHCGRSIKREDKYPGPKKQPDLCPKCYEEHSEVVVVTPRLGKLLEDRWCAGTLKLTAEGVVSVNPISGLRVGDNERIYAVATLTLTPLEKLTETMQLGPYLFESRFGHEDAAGEDGFNILRGEKLVAVIRKRTVFEDGKALPGKYWERAYAWDKDTPGKLKWNRADADRYTDVGVVIELLLDELERSYEAWAQHNLRGYIPNISDVEE